MMPEKRKLAAILAADVVGYSRLASADEDRTLARLRALRSDLIDPTIAVHNGRVIKRTGDGALVEFRSVVDAVRCAIEVQNGMVERNAGVPQDRRIEFRIGIHLGDVVEESDGDLMGDGVNIASRLEGVAAPGAICLSEDAYRQVKAQARPLGQRSWQHATQEHRRSDPGLFAAGRRRGKGEAVQRQSRSRPRTLESAAEALDRRLALPQHERRCRAGVFRRRDLRRHHHGSLKAAAAVRDRPQFVLHFQGQERERSGGGQEPRRALCAGGQRPQVRQQGTDHRAADRRDHGRTSVGGAFRSRPDRHLRRAGRRDAAHCRRARAQSDGGRQQRLATEHTDNLAQPLPSSQYG